jgi:thiosulfate/3-mercaptopyruvate sulfurtransferase
MNTAKSFQTLISARETAQMIGHDQAIVIDCQFELAKPNQVHNDAGRRRFLAGHLPGARFVDVETDLSDLSLINTHGRHPLPSAEAFNAVVRRLGIKPGDQVIVYDQGGGMFAARFWWLMRAIGHLQVALLDGGLAHWLRLQLPISTQAVEVTNSDYPLTALSAMPRQPIDSLLKQVELGSTRLVDARAKARFLGEEEPVDRVAGHIPGALNRPFSENLDADGLWLPALELKRQWLTLLGSHEQQQVVQMCGSGVTACHNILSMLHAGMGESALFAESWSGWICDPKHPVQGRSH